MTSTCVFQIQIRWVLFSIIIIFLYNLASSWLINNLIFFFLNTIINTGVYWSKINHYPFFQIYEKSPDL
jgi:hypothetical protein